MTAGLRYHRAKVHGEGVRMTGANLRMFFLLIAVLAVLVAAFLIAAPALV